MENNYNELRFKNLEDLYNRILPALKSKADELKHDGYKYIHEEDIWNYLKTYKWMESRDLDLGCMVNDIFGIDKLALNEFVTETIKDYRRNIEQEEMQDV